MFFCFVWVCWDFSVKLTGEGGESGTGVKWPKLVLASDLFGVWDCEHCFVCLGEEKGFLELKLSARGEVVGGNKV